MQFDRYAFDLSQFAGDSQVTHYSVRERYLWELFRPDPNDALFKLVPGQFRSELHDRILGPIYPFAFLVLAYTFLGAPSTTRQSRIWSIVTLTVGVVSLRLMGFISSIVGQSAPLLIAVQYLLLATTIGVCLFAISRGMIIEPPASLTNRVNALIGYVKRRALAMTGAAR